MTYSEVLTLLGGQPDGDAEWAAYEAALACRSADEACNAARAVVEWLTADEPKVVPPSGEGVFGLLADRVPAPKAGVSQEVYDTAVSEYQEAQRVLRDADRNFAVAAAALPKP